MLVRERTMPSSSNRKAMLLLPPPSFRPKYVSRNLWASGTFVTVRFRWLSFISRAPWGLVLPGGSHRPAGVCRSGQGHVAEAEAHRHLDDPSRRPVLELPVGRGAEA